MSTVIRFAIYTRVSSDMQNEVSLETQENACRAEVASRGGIVTAVYSDNARSGWSLARPGFAALQQAAARGEFEAVMFWTFDRLARDGNHAMMIKLLLRHEYNIKLYCVHGYSEDDDSSPQTALMEQALAVYSAFYSKHLSIETRRGKRNRALRGEFNGSTAPLGYDLVTYEYATRSCPAGLHINPRQAALVRRVFRLYATGKYTDLQLAHWLNARPLIQKLRAGRLPISKDFVREMLQNRVYTGRVCHAETIYIDEFGAGKRANRNRKEWFEGKHDGFISDELFERCKKVRDSKASHHQAFIEKRIYVLQELVFCAACLLNKPEGIIDSNYGKMRGTYDEPNIYYRCRNRERGYQNCKQLYSSEIELEEQLVTILNNISFTEKTWKRFEKAIHQVLEQEAINQRFARIQLTMEQLGINPESLIADPQYLEKRAELQTHIERIIQDEHALTPLEIFANFMSDWGAAKTAEIRRAVIKKIVQQIYVVNQQIVAVIITGNVPIVVTKNAKISQEIVRGINEKIRLLCGILPIYL